MDPTGKLHIDIACACSDDIDCNGYVHSSVYNDGGACLLYYGVGAQYAEHNGRACIKKEKGNVLL